MYSRVLTRRFAPALLLGAIVVLTACSQAASPAPTAAPAKPTAAAAAPTAAPAAQPTKPAAEPTKPAAAKAPVVELRAGSSNPQGDNLSNGLDRLAENIAKKSNGEIKVNVFYGGALGAEQQLTQAVMSGSVDLGMISGGNAARFTDLFLVYDLPFLVKNYDMALQSLDSPAGKELMAKFEKETGLKMLFVESYGSGRDLQSRNKQLKVPADVKGLKIRVISSPVDFSIMKAWGANPTPVDWGQTFAALQQGVVDGENVPVASVYGNKHYEVVKHHIRLDYQAIFEMVHMNQKKFDGLSAAHQKAIMDAAAETKTWHWENSKAEVSRNIQELNKLGTTVYTPTPEEWAQWASVREKVWQEVNEELKGKVDLVTAKKLYDASQ